VEEVTESLSTVDADADDDDNCFFVLLG
jgi:hypothetical protein